jgi:hypothetical protein
MHFNWSSFISNACIVAVLDADACLRLLAASTKLDRKQYGHNLCSKRLYGHLSTYLTTHTNRIAAF